MQSSGVRGSIAVLSDTFERYSPDEVAFAFNGGKDCCVVLHLLCIHFSTHLKSLTIVHFESDDEFDEIQSFVADTATLFKLSSDIDVVRCGSLRQGLASLKQRLPRVRAVICGNRSTDPHSDNLAALSPTTEGWPEFMRVNPILPWTYEDVWLYILDHHVPYCSLYEQGFTSIGGRSTTKPNPLLRLEDGSYRHARDLEGGAEHERDGRTF